MPKAKNLKYYRLKANLTQAQFAKAFGVSRKTVINWEKAKTSIPAPSTARLAEFFDVPETEFRNIDQEMLQELVAEPIQLTEREKQNILLFRELPDDIQILIRSAIIQAYKRSHPSTHHD